MTVKTFVSMYVVSFLVEHFCFTCLILTTFNVWMLHKLAMKFKGNEINGLQNMACDQITQLFTKVESMIPRYKEPKLKSS